jgi:hypothetical protein
MNMAHAFQKYQKELIRVAGDKGLWLRNLGACTSRLPLWFVQTDPMHDRRTRLLITAGFHGEEKAGPWGILKWLKEFDPKILKKVSMSFLPVANPSAFDRGVRYNTLNEKSNCGFCHPEKGEKPSMEGEVILSHFDYLLGSAKNGFLSLHEDAELAKEYYTYTFEEHEKPGDFTCGLLDCLAGYWEKPLNGYCASTDADLQGHLIVNGVAFRVCDGSLEDALFHKGVPLCAVTETPGKAKFETRVECHAALIDKFIELCLGR